MENQVKVIIAKAPVGWTTREVLTALKLDPYQMRVSQHPIILKNPKTGVTKFLSEYVDEIINDSRFAIETEDALVFVSRVKNSSLGNVFIPTYVMPRSEWKKNPEAAKKIILRG